MMETGSSRRRCLIYPGPVHLFLTTGMYYAAELAQTFDVDVVLDRDQRDRLPAAVEDALTRRRVQLHWIDGGRLLRKHRNNNRQARRLIARTRPHVVLLNDDMGEFNVYLARVARRHGIPRICFQSGPIQGPRSLSLDYAYALRAYCTAWAGRFGLPHWIGRRGAKLLLHARHYWHYWIAPLLIGQRPFPGRSSIYLAKGRSSLRDGQRVVRFERESHKFIGPGEVDPDRLVFVRHPITSASGRALFDEIFPLPVGKQTDRILVLVDFSLQRSSDAVTAESVICENTERLVVSIRLKHPEVDIVLKPHPGLDDSSNIVRHLKSLASEHEQVSFVDGSVNAISLLPATRVVIGEASTVQIIARLLGGITVVSVRLDGEAGGSPFADNTGIHGFVSMDSLLATDLLSLPPCSAKPANPLGPGYEDFVEFMTNTGLDGYAN